MKFNSIGVLSDCNEESSVALNTLAEAYNIVQLDTTSDYTSIDIIVALGGDGFMLSVLHKHVNLGIPIYGINCGTTGFLMNEKPPWKDVVEKINNSKETVIHPLKMYAIDKDGDAHEAIAFNEVSLLRSTGQAAKIKISLDSNVMMDEVVCDGVLLSTPAGSTAYNFSVGGPVLPIKSNLLALTPISAFRPRRWRGAILPHNITARFDVIDHSKRPVSAVADFTEVKNIVSVEIKEDRLKQISLLFDPGHSLEDRIIREQFL